MTVLQSIVCESCEEKNNNFDEDLNIQGIQILFPNRDLSLFSMGKEFGRFKKSY